ncbi:MAG: VOC family protein [Ginsengibacter sp.]
MAINPTTKGVHHIALRCTDMEATKNFYRDVLGFTLALDTPDIIGFLAGNIILAFKKADAKQGEEVFTPFNIGLDHIALACETDEELQRVAKELSEAGIENTGVKLDETLQKMYVAFKDPDRIQWEFYMI